MAGFAAVAVSLSGILVAVGLAPWFAWRTDALSNLGVATGPERLVFNGTLLLTGVLGLAFLPALRTTMRATAHRVAQLPLVVGVVAIAGVGLFPAGHPYHFPLAATGYLGFIAAPVAYGVGDFYVGARRRAAATVASGLLHLGVWVAWATLLDDALPGLAAPEFVGALLFNAWVAYTAVRVYRTGTRGRNDARAQ